MLTRGELEIIREETEAIVPKLTQHQGSLEAQIAQAMMAMERLGLYDAQDYFKRLASSPRTNRHTHRLRRDD